MKIKVNKFGEGFCRSDRWIINEYDVEVDIDKIRNEEDEDNLNDVEMDIKFGDFGFCEYEGKLDVEGRIDKLIKGESVLIEREEETFILGVGDEMNELEVEFMKWKLEIMDVKA